MAADKELAYRYDLFIAPDWRERFEALIDDKIELPARGRILDANCGTGSRSIELAQRMQGQGEVIGTDPSLERVDIARAKAQVQGVDCIVFEQADMTNLPFEDGYFDMVIGDASLPPGRELAPSLAEIARVGRPGAKAVLKFSPRGAFGEFYSVYWEVLNDLALSEQVLPELEALIKGGKTLFEVEQIAGQAGLIDVETFSAREEFVYQSAEAFLTAPLIKDYFLDFWLGIAPADRRADMLSKIAAAIERERHGKDFETSFKAAILKGVKAS